VQCEVGCLAEGLHPYVVFLPSEQKTRILGAIFGSKACVDVLKFSLDQGISAKAYQKDLVKRLSYSNKTVIQNLKSLTRMGVLKEEMEKNERNGRTVWVKFYQLTDSGKWFALLLAEEKDLSRTEKAKILQTLFKSYLEWVKKLSKELQIDKKTLEETFVSVMGKD
jgi:predicted ArsR family transcriptional regulator